MVSRVTYKGATKNQTFVSKEVAFAALKQDARLEEKAGFKKVKDKTKGSTREFVEEFWYSNVEHITNFEFKNMVIVQFHIPGHELGEGVLSRPHLHARPAKFKSGSTKEWEVDSQGVLSDVVLDHYYTCVPELHKMQRNEKIQDKWRILEYSEAKDLRTEIKELMHKKSIVAFSTGQFDGKDFSENCGPDVKEKIVIKIDYE